MIRIMDRQPDERTFTLWFDLSMQFNEYCVRNEIYLD